MAGTVKGPAIFLAQFAGELRTLQFLEVDLRMGR